MKAETYSLFKRVFDVLKPPPDMSLADWADEYRILSKKTSAEPGRWKTSKAPYQREIMNAISDISVQKVVVMSAAQIGKTDGFILNPIGYFMHYDPSPILVMQPNIKPLGESFSKDRLTPMLRDTPVLRDKVDDKLRTGTNTILHKEFPGGHITIVGANSPSGLRSRPIRILLADEIDGYPASAGNDGDPLLLADKRLTTFWNKKIVLISTPTIKGTSRIELEFEKSTQEVWHVPCPACGEYQELLWANVIFKKENLNEIEYLCEKCGVLSGEVDWKEKYTSGKFIPRFPGRKTRGFFLNSLASLFVEWREIVEKFLVANEEKKKGNIALLKAWTNIEMGQTWEEEGEEIEPDSIYKRREKYNAEVPAGVICLTAGVDTQDDRLEVEVVGWGEDFESWGIKYQVFYGDLKKEDVWNRLSKLLDKTFAREDGAKLRIVCACIDSGGHFTNEVYKFCKKRFSLNTFAIKGFGGFSIPYIGNASTSNRAKTHLIKLGVDIGKHQLYQRLAVENAGAGYCHFPENSDCGYDEDYFKGLTSEKMVLTYKKGIASYVWKKKTSGYRNEPLDCRNYAQAALEIAGGILILKKSDKKETAPLAKKKGRRTISKGVD
ncbi:MAG: phage terminase large subunit family protein [Oscillospiraceae bacterium]|nr:phage terminase large subunit family protein [Oscillospiraceae bacterium]